MKTRILAAENTATEKSQIAQSAYNYNPIYQKLTRLTWNAPSGGYHYYGPPPDVGTSYGMWWDKSNKFGVISPVPENGTTIYSPASGEELDYEGPADSDAIYSLVNFKGEYHFMPPTSAGDTCLTTAPIFSDNLKTETMFNPMTGSNITREYKTMMSNRTKTARPAVSVQAAAAPSMKSGLGANPHKSLDKGNLNPKTGTGGSDDKTKSKSVNPAKIQPLKDTAKMLGLNPKHAILRLDAATIDRMSEAELSKALLAAFSLTAEGEEASPPPAKSAPPPAEKSPPKSASPAPKSASPAPKSAPPPAAPPPPADSMPADEGGAPPAEPMPMDDGSAPPAEPMPMDEGAPPPAEPMDDGSAPPAEPMPADEGGEQPAEQMPMDEGAPPPEGMEQAPEQMEAPPEEGQPPMDQGQELQPGDEVEPQAPEVPPSPMKQEARTPETRKSQGAKMTTSAADKAKQMKALALKVLSDPNYIEANKGIISTAVTEANQIIESAKKKSHAEGSGFNSDMKAYKKARDEAHKQMKSNESGFYNEHIQKAREETMKELHKVSSMIDDKILASLAEEDESHAGDESHEEELHMAKSDHGMESHEMDEMPMAEGDAFDMDALSSVVSQLERQVTAKLADTVATKETNSSLRQIRAEIASLEKEIATAEAFDLSKVEDVPEEEMEGMDIVGDEPEADAAYAKRRKSGSKSASEKSASEKPKSEKSEAAMECVSNVEELESEGPITAAAVHMHLFGEGGVNPFWNITASGEPVGRVYLQDQADPETDRTFFTSAKYATGVAQAIEKVGLGETLASINAKLFANRIEKADLVKRVQAQSEQVIKATVANKTASLRDELVDRMMVAQSALDKNMFKDEGNSLKDALYVQMKKFGVQNPVPYIEAAFEQGATDYFKTVLAKAVEFLDMEPKAFEQIKKTVANSDVLAPETVEADTEIPEARAMSLAAHLSNSNLPMAFGGNTVNASYSDIKQNLRMGLSLKKTV